MENIKKQSEILIGIIDRHSASAAQSNNHYMVEALKQIRKGVQIIQDTARINS